MAKRFWRGAGALLLVVGGLACCVASAAADTLLTSPHYHFDESALGGSGNLQSSSANYNVSEVIGDAAIGNTGSSNYQIIAGSKTTGDPALTFTIISANPNFGSFSPSAATTATASFAVSNYTSYGYIVQITGNPPSNGSHVITAMSSTGPSQAGIEQFGINLVANTSPASVGANPDLGQFGAGGAAAANYNTSNQYRYVNGETIAVGSKSSGLTTYTISYIVNVTGLTPGGQYSTNQTLICVGTF